MKKNLPFILFILLSHSVFTFAQNKVGNSKKINYLDSVNYYCKLSQKANGIDSATFDKALEMEQRIDINQNSINRIEKISKDFRNQNKPRNADLIMEVLINKISDSDDLDFAIHFFKNIIEKYDLTPDPHQRYTALSALVQLRKPLRKKNIQETFDYYTSRLKVYLNKNDSAATAITYFCLSTTYRLTGLPDMTIYNIKKSLSYIDKSDTTSKMPINGLQGWMNNTSVLGQLYLEVGDYKSAILHSKAARNVRINILKENNVSFLNCNIAIAKLKMNDLSRVDKYLNSAIELASVNRDYPSLVRSLETKGQYFIAINQLDSAEAYLLKCKEVMRLYDVEYFSPAGSHTPDYYLAKVRILQNRLKDARKLLEEEIKEMESIKQEMLKELHLLIEVYHKLGDAKAADSAFKKYSELQAELSAEERKNRTKSFEIEAKIEDAENTINALSTEKKIADITKKYLIGIALLMFIVAAIIFNRFRVTRKQKTIIEKEKNLSEELRRSAERSEAFKQQFLANMSHEIRTPMNAVMGMTNLVLETPLEPKQKDYLIKVKKSSDNLLHIINDILDLSKIEAGKMELEQIDMSLSETIDQVKQTLLHKAEEKGLELFVKIDPQVQDIVLGDPVRLNQVLINLAGNAIKFTEKGSVVIEVKKTENKVRFSIIDTGIGIPENKIKTVFENFGQANTSDTRKYGGTGLGLSISQQLVELMGGIIEIESEVGRGTTFFFELELVAGNKERYEEHNAREENVDAKILNGLTILIADDNEYNRIVARDTLLSRADVTVIEAENGQEVIDKLTEKVDVILMDVQMPVLSGFEATTKIRATGNVVPIIALTASVLRTDLDRCKDAGMNGYIPKPFKANELIVGIAETLNIKLKLVSEKKQEVQKETTGASLDKVTNLNYLREFCEGDEVKMKRYIEMFLKSAPTFLEKLDELIKEEDAEGIANHVHGFNTKLIMMGMKETKSLSVEIENELREWGTKKDILERIQKLRRHVEKSIHELKM